MIWYYLSADRRFELVKWPIKWLILPGCWAFPDDRWNRESWVAEPVRCRVTTWLWPGSDLRLDTGTQLHDLVHIELFKRNTIKKNSYILLTPGSVSRWTVMANIPSHLPTTADQNMSSVEKENIKIQGNSIMLQNLICNLYNICILFRVRCILNANVVKYLE